MIINSSNTFAHKLQELHKKHTNSHRGFRNKIIYAMHYDREG